MRSAFLILTLIATTGTAQARRPPTTTWGKPGISFDTYRRDARECGMLGANADIERWQPTKAAVAGTREQDRIVETMGISPNSSVADYGLVYQRSIRGNVRDVQRTMVGVVAACLMDRGYREVVLDKAQARQLRKLKPGTEARARYLYAVGAGEAGVGSREAV